VTVLGLTIATGVALTGAPLSVWQAATTAGWTSRSTLVTEAPAEPCAATIGCATGTTIPSTMQATVKI
jgi:hypothetical protein